MDPLENFAMELKYAYDSRRNYVCVTLNSIRVYFDDDSLLTLFELLNSWANW